MAGTRISALAKELNVTSKAILEKCRAEGIPEDAAKSAASTVGPGLEQTIREWFTAGANATAVETSRPVDLDQVRAKPRSAKAGHDSSDDGGGPVATTVEAPAEPRPRRVPSARSRVSPPGDRDGHASEPPAESTPAHVEPPAEVTAPSRPAAAPVPAAEPKPVEAPKAPERAHALPHAPSPQPVPAAPAASAPAAPRTGPAHPPRADEGPKGPGPAGPGIRPGAPRPPAGPPPRMNVPVRPKVVTPAGPQLQAKAPVRLSGPKIIRVEAPDPVEAPRPRRAPASGGPVGGGGATTGGRGAGGRFGGPSTGEREDDRNPRRTQNKRRTSGEGSGGIPARRRGMADEMPAAGAWTEQDLAEREARLQRSGGYMKMRRQQAKRQQGGPGQSMGPAGAPGRVVIAAPFTIKELSEVTGIKSAEIVKKLFLKGVMATINSGIDPEKAQEIMIDFDIELEVTTAKTAEEAVSDEMSNRKALDERARGPVVTILGHVDHGKTSLLDKIRNANVAAGEAGGITQATSAFRVPVKVGEDTKDVVFLDTPGHQAFTEMRSRGANMTDVVVLVVSAPEGVMPQTIESINHARAAKVPIVVALNKIDRADATDAVIQKTLSQLADAGVSTTEWGGDTDVIRTSATTGKGIPELLETLDYQAQLLGLTADFAGPARGTVIESKVEPGRGAVANILVRDGCLKVGDFIVAGRAFGRVRDITNDRGQKLKEATPPMPVQISGIDEIPDAGDKFFVVESLRQAQDAAEQRRDREREAQLSQPKVTLDSLFNRMSESDTKEILVVLKADVQGSVDAIKGEIERITSAEVKVRVLHAAVGGVTESDVILAEASKAIIVGFNVIPSGKARRLAEDKGVEIRAYRVIYDIMDDLKAAAEGMLAPEVREEILGHAEVRQVFKITKVGAIAGCYVTNGVVQRDALVRVTRGGVVIEHDRRLAQLKRFKDDAKDVRAGMECGMKIDGYDDIKEGDIIECYKKVEVKRTL
ncbi:MAG: translation initiation factor IF-2 [Phycisphaerales bacterium]|nr:translation initiation factor IF-2 [Phycisphaerales bacterium]